MQPEARKYLWDAIEAAQLALQFVQGKTFEDYQADALLRSGVERQLMIVGEALGRLRTLDRPAADRIADLPRAVGLRNVLAHAYADVDDAVIWGLLSGPLRRMVEDMRSV